MDDAGLLRLSCLELRALLDKGEITSFELTNACLRRIEEVDKKVNAYITVDRDGALMGSKKADEMIRKGESRPFTGIPIGLKDVLCTKGLRTTCASKILKDFIPPYDATVVERLRAEGAVILGKLNMDEFAMGSSTENSAFFPTKNPWNLDCIPGGSSGGSAASVASLTSCASLGSDTGGSIRQPASHCGIVGMKPAYGRVSRFGLVAFASSLDQIGPMTKTVKDCALMLNSIAGSDIRDSTSHPSPCPDFLDYTDRDIKGMTIGVPLEYMSEGLHNDVKEAVEGAISKLEDAGAVIKEITLPHTEYAVSAYYIIAPSEASSNLMRYDGVKYGFRAGDYDDLMDMYIKTRSMGFGQEVKRRIMLGTFSLASGYYDAYYKKASQVRGIIAEDFQKAFNECDIILAPVAPTPAFRLGEKTDDPLEMYLSDIFTIPVNLAGLPAISVPCALSSSGLPIGIQFIGPQMGDHLCIQFASFYERLRGNFGECPIS